MYIALQCPHCGGEHPLRSFSLEKLFALLFWASTYGMSEIANNNLTDDEWILIILAEILLRKK